MSPEFMFSGSATNWTQAKQKAAKLAAGSIVLNEIFGRGERI